MRDTRAHAMVIRKQWNPSADVRHPTHARASNPSQARNTHPTFANGRHMPSKMHFQPPTTHRTCDSYCLANCRAALRNEPSVPAAPPPWPPWPGCAQQALHTRRCTECSAPVPPQSCVCVCVWAPASWVCASTDLVVAAPGSTEKDRALMSVTDMVAPLDLPDLLKAAANNNAT